MNPLLITFAILIPLSCFREELNLTPTGLLHRAKKIDSKVKVVPIPDEEAHRRVLCSDYEVYASGCVPGSGMRLKVGIVELVVIRFDNSKNAAKVARKIGQWHTHNWVLDDVTGEATLEDFVQRAFNAKTGK